jgi:hypothetical protein
MIDPYIVDASVGGNCHTFIATLLIHLLKSIDCNNRYISDTGNAHLSYHLYAKVHLNTKTTYSNPNPSYTYVTTKTNLPPVFFEYRNIDFAILKKQHPNFKFIRILYDEDDKLSIEFNHFYKNYKDASIVDNIYWDLYLKINKNSNTIRKGLTSFSEFTEQEIKELLTIRAGMKHLVVNKQLWYDYKQEFPDNIFLVNFKDIINNMETVITVLEEATGKQRTNGLVKSYLNYVKNHQSFAKKNYSLLPK